MYINIQIYIYIYIHIHIYISLSLYIYIYIYIHTYTCIYTCIHRGGLCARPEVREGTAGGGLHLAQLMDTRQRGGAVGRGCSGMG